MAPIKFEENIKEKLEKRTIDPSADAWSSLSANLKINDKKNTRGVLFYIGIAASIIGVLFVTRVLFNTSANELIQPAVVDTNTKASQIKLEEKRSNEVVGEDVIVPISEENTREDLIYKTKLIIKNEPKLATRFNQSSNIQVEKKADQPTENEFISSKNRSQAIASVNSVTRREEQPIGITLTYEEVKAIEVINQIKKLETENGIVTDAEIDNLLKQAEREILREHLYNETTRIVDANALLQDVEDDLEQSFRTKVFEGLKSSYKTVLTAVTERNN
ncbi:hypothetical protein [Psychroserpens sp.]|jgi:hypothetical protein|uniref:hypothetical protein n=1 Tax=Psychroserpens sp. TaxID=2020870 RepID=UPI0039E3EC23